MLLVMHRLCRDSEANHADVHVVEDRIQLKELEVDKGCAGKAF
jgi:hypothetical protein